MHLKLVKTEEKEKYYAQEFDEVEIVCTLAEQLLDYYNLSTEDAIYIADHLKSSLEELQQAEKDGTLDEFNKKFWR
ncbi:hypothetical protein MKY64_30555 [Paenibacillus sp. FSL R7-0210]|uniref:hypothetical protein n=1 Tax=Paenibacillus sp. FSL R7-0210 TaxID=2921676 RepID=UPI0030F988AB